MQNNPRSLIDAGTLTPPLVLSVLLVLSSQISFILFHTLAESFAIFIALLATVVAWQMYSFTRNHFLMYLGCGYFWVAMLDGMHALAYKGMSMVTVTGTEIAVQFWIGTRYLEAVLLLTAPWFLSHSLKRNLVFSVYGVIAIILSVLVMSGNFPEGFVEGKGLTKFKIYSEYVIIGILAMGILYLFYQRKLMDQRVFVLMVASMSLTMMAELAFTFYISVYGLSNLAGHIFKLFSFWLIYVAVVRTTLREPFSALSKAETHYDAVPDAAIIVDNKGIVQHVNKAACLLADKAIVELVGKHSHDIFHDQRTDRKDCHVCQSILDGVGLSAYEMKTDDDSWCDFSTSNIESDKSFIEVIRNITDKKKTASALEKSEAKLNTLIETLPDLVWLKDKKGVYLSCNAKVERLIGVKKGDILGKNDYDFFDKELADSFRANDQAAADAGKPRINEEEIVYADDGHKEVVETIKTPMFDSDGDLIGVLGIARDITERKKMERALKDNSDRFIRWQESNFIGIVHVRANGEIVEANNTLLDMLGYSRQDLIDGVLDWAKLTPDEFLGLDEKALIEASEKGYWTPFEKEYFHKDGHRVPVHVGGSAFQSDNDQYIIFIIDLTEREQQEEQLRRSQKMDALGKMTGGIAHDYNNMLGVILGYSELLLGSMGEQSKQAEYAQAITRAGERGAKLTNKLLAFSRKGSAGAEMLNLNTLLRDERHMLEKTLTVRIQLTLDLADNLWFARLDGGDLEDAIINMSINAMHAIDGNGQLSLRTSNEKLSVRDAKLFDLEPGDYVMLAITDTGCGMDKVTKERIFEPFYSTKGEKGTGLGLSQVYGFVERSNGAIRVYSEIGRGTRFTLYFPRYYENSRDQQLAEYSLPLDVKGNETILAVDDEPALLDLAREILSQQGYKVICAHSGEQALNILATESIDLLISDVIMPEMNGYQLAKEVIKKYPKVKIQLVSGFSGENHKELVDHDLRQNLLHKPYGSDVLLARVRTLLDDQPYE